MANTSNIILPLMAQNQAQKYVTFNEAMLSMDVLTQLRIIDRNLTAPPGSPADGAVYIPASGATDAWSGKADNLAAYINGTWKFYVPKEGWQGWVIDENIYIYYTGAAWDTVSTGGGASGTIDVRLYGAVPDARSSNSMVCTSGSATATCADGAFVTADVGKQIKIYDQTTGTLVFRGTILARTNGTTITLSGNALATLASGNGIAYWGTDNATAINAAIDAAAALVGEPTFLDANHAIGRGAIRVLFPIDSAGDAYLFNSTLTPDIGVAIDADAMLFSNTGGGLSDRTWAINDTYGSHIYNLVMECGGGMGIDLGTAATNASTVVKNLQMWSVGTNYNGALTPQAQIALRFTGFDISFERIWTKGGNIGMHLNEASDIFIDRAILIGPGTGLQLTSCENVRINQVVIDTGSYNALAIDGSHNCVINMSAFAVNNTALSFGVLMGEYDSTNINRNIRLTYGGQKTGGVGAKISYTEDSVIDLNLSNSALYPTVTNTITTALVYGSGNTGSLKVLLNRDGDITTGYSGTLFGVLVDTVDGLVTIYGNSLNTLGIRANTMRPSATGGCAALANVATVANQPDVQSLDFDATTAEYAQVFVPMPKSWNRGTVTAQFLWSHAATTTNFGVRWGIQGVAISDDDTLAVAFGTAQEVTDTGGTTNDLYMSPKTSAITIAGSPAAEDVVCFRVYRLPTDAADTMAIDARLMGIKIFYTSNISTDA